MCVCVCLPTLHVPHPRRVIASKLITPCAADKSSDQLSTDKLIEQLKGNVGWRQLGASHDAHECTTGHSLDCQYARAHALSVSLSLARVTQRTVQNKHVCTICERTPCERTRNG